MKKITIGAFLLAGIFGIANTSFAAEGGTRYFGELETFLPGNVADGEEADLKASVLALVALGSSDSYTITTPVAIGGRIGLLYPVEDVGDVGLSVGYIAGPSSEVIFTDNNPGLGISNIDYTRKLSFVRALVELRKAYTISDNWTFKPGVGVGMAFGSNKNTVTRATNYFAGATIESATWSGVTWEATAGFAYKMTNSDLTFAVRYAAFPTFKENVAKDLAKIDWGTVGFSIGLEY